MTEPAADCGRVVFIRAILDAVSSVRIDAHDHRTISLDADLAADLGLDSIEILGIWVGLETAFGLPEGELGVTQALTIRSLADEMSRLTQSMKPVP